MRRILLVILASLTLLWPAAINGGPFWFPDTTNYVRAADAAVVVATGFHSEWSDRLVAGSAPSADTAAAAGAEAPPLAGADEASRVMPTRQVLAGRSIYYGFLIYLPMALFGPWAAIVLQALATGALVTYCSTLILKRCTPAQADKAVWIVPLLAIFTPLSFYTCMLMPDVYSGLQILSLGTLLGLWRGLPSRDRLVLLAALAVMVTFHTTHVLLVLALALAAALFAAGQMKARLRSLAVGAGLAAVGFVANAAFSIAVEQATGAKPLAPPFLTARLTDDGPGKAYLDRNCRDAADHPFLVCRYRTKLPLESDSFLWSLEPVGGLFQLLTPAEQRRIAAEDSRFFLAVLLDDPLSMVGLSAASTFEQMGEFGLESFNYDSLRRTKIEDTHPPLVLRDVVETRAWSESMPVAPTNTITVLATLLGLVVLGPALIRLYRRGDEADVALRRALVLIVIGVVANAAICGVLSGPRERYQMRLIWLIPYAASLAALAWHRWRSQAAQPGPAS